MSKSKEMCAPRAAGTRTRWFDASPAHRCPVCGGDSWCGWPADLQTVMCHRVESDRERLSKEGAPYWVHHLGAVPRDLHRREIVPTVQRAGPEELDRAYNAVLAHLRLDMRDREMLRARGLSDAAIDAEEYRTLPVRGRAELARVVERAVGDYVMPGVPGIVRRESDGRAWWGFAGRPGVLIPCRDREGRVAALKIRATDAPEKGSRYSYVSSRFADGPSAQSIVHVPVAARDDVAGNIILTEGPLKASVACELTRPHRAVVSIPGVGARTLAVDFVRAVRPRSVSVALDMDRLTNPHVARAQLDIVNALRAEGVVTRVLSWPPEHKGLDEHLLWKRSMEALRAA